MVQKILKIGRKLGKAKPFGFILRGSILLFWLINLTVLGVFLTLKKIEGGLRIPSYLKMSHVLPLVGHSVMAFVLVAAIVVFLCNRYKVNKDKATYYFALAFSFYLWTFAGLILRGLKMFSSTGAPEPISFFIFRMGMIWFITFMLYGVQTIFRVNKKLKIIHFIAFLVWGYSWFIYGVIIKHDINLTVFGFLYFVFGPALAVISYVFYRMRKMTKLKSLKYLSWGFAGLSIAYYGGTAFYGTTIYYYFYRMVNLSLVLILLGFMILPYEKLSKKWI